MKLNKKEIEKHLKYLEYDKYNDEFYVALLLYDILGIKYNELKDEDITKAYKLREKYNSIYNEVLIDELSQYDEIEYDEDYEEEEEYLHEKD